MAVQQAMSLSQFVAWQNTQEMKYEYDRGRIIPRIVAMAGASRSHDQIEINLVQEVANAFEDSHFWPFTSGKLIATEDGEVGYFPDAVLLDGEPVTVRYGKHEAAINPVAVFEIASPGTREYDEGRKLDVYKSIPTMREVVLIESDQAKVVRHFRAEDGWADETIVGLDATLRVLEVSIPLARIYRKVDLSGTDGASAHP